MRTFRTNRATLLLAASCLAGFATRLNAQKPATVDQAVLKNAGTPKDQFPGSWLNYGKSQSETRYSPLKQIDTSNVKRLGLEWTYVLGAGGGNQEATPLVWNNTIYGITSWSVVFALDGRTGKEVWRWDPELNQSAVREQTGLIVNRGLALYNGLIIAPCLDGRLIALNALTGKPAWEARVAYTQDGHYLTMAPRIAGSKVIVGISGGDKGENRGYFDAYDAMNGQRAWRFYTVPGDPKLPYENEAMRVAAKTWGGDFYKKGGGGAVWDGFAYDPDANLVYVGTGNAEPWVQKFRGAQNVDNLYTCSILAVDLTTGQLKWYFQTVPNDNWDFDSVQQLMLLDLTIEGRQRKVLTQAAKNGFFYALDRVSGQFISGAPFVKVNWAKGLNDSGRPLVNPEAYYDTEPVAVYPTGGGAHNWAPMSFNPNTGLVYIPASYQPYTYQADEDYKPRTNGDVRTSVPPRQIKAPAIGPMAPDGIRGGLQAWDPVKHTLVWRADGGGGIGGGTVTTGGNLVFHVINDGHFVAYSADKGEKLFDVQTGRTGMAPPITYEIEGKQYVAFLGGAAPASWARWMRRSTTRRCYLYSRLMGRRHCPRQLRCRRPAAPGRRGSGPIRRKRLVALPCITLTSRSNAMQITSKGQVTIPLNVRTRLGLLPHTEVEFELFGDHARIRKSRHQESKRGRGQLAVELLRGSGDVRMSTDEILALTRGEPRRTKRRK